MERPSVNERALKLFEILSTLDFDTTMGCARAKYEIKKELKKFTKEKTGAHSQ